MIVYIVFDTGYDDEHVIAVKSSLDKAKQAAIDELSPAVFEHIKAIQWIESEDGKVIDMYGVTLQIEKWEVDN